MTYFKSGAGLVIGIVLALALAVGLAIGVAHLSNFTSSKTAEPRGERAVRENTQANGAFRQATYEDFFSLCSSVQTAEGQIKNLQDELKTKPSADRVENINTSLLALKNQRVAAISEYNTKAAEQHRAAFKDANLPAKLYNTTEETECVA